MDTTRETLPMARRESSRRAMSLLEMAAVVAMLALLTLAGISRFGYNTLGNGGAEGFTRQLALALAHARRATISTGDNHYLQLSPASGNVTSFVLTRRTGGGRRGNRPNAIRAQRCYRYVDFEGAGIRLRWHCPGRLQHLNRWSRPQLERDRRAADRRDQDNRDRAVKSYFSGWEGPVPRHLCGRHKLRLRRTFCPLFQAESPEFTRCVAHDLEHLALYTSYKRPEGFRCWRWCSRPDFWREPWCLLWQ